MARAGDKLPLSALKYRIDAILRDGRMTASQRVAAVGVALHGNKQTGLAYPGERYLRREYHVGGKTIRETLTCPKPGEDKEPGLAIDVHLEPAGRGPHGVQQYRVVPGQLPGRKSDGSHGSTGVPSAPTGGALNPPSAPETADSAPVSPASAPGCAAQRAPGGRETVVERGMNGEEERAGGFAALCRLAFGANVSERQARRFRACVSEAKARGAPDALLANRLNADGAEPFKTVRECGKDVRGLLQEFTALTGIESPTLARVLALEFDTAAPDGMVRQADLEDFRDRHADLLQPARGDNETVTHLLAIAPDDGASEKARAILANRFHEALAAGVPAPYLAHALRSKRLTGGPADRIKTAKAVAREVV
ncbi:MAG: hypothetical protein U9R68_09745, partial [Planctomycetota bacterium]|nr:hypothetical protein [Planctomycetota bacterium]